MSSTYRTAPNTLSSGGNSRGDVPAIARLGELDLVPIEDEAIAISPGSGVVLMLNRSATCIVRLARSGFNRKEIIQAIAEHADLAEDKIREDIAGLEHTVHCALAKASKIKTERARVVSPLDPPILRATYSIFERRVRIEYPDYNYSSFLHPYFVVFQIEESEPDIVMQFEVGDSVCTVRCGEASFMAPAKGGEGAMGAICQALLFFDKPKQEALEVFMHCGSVLGQHGAWLICGASGKGKSTMVTALDAVGHTTLADDIMPIDPAARFAYPVPIAMAIKAGSWDRVAVTHSGHIVAQTHQTVNGKTVRRIAPRNPPRSADRAGHPIAGFLFPDRTNENVVAIEPLGVKDAMISLCDKYGRFPTKHSDLEDLVACVASVPRYRLRYRDADSMVAKLSPLL